MLIVLKSRPLTHLCPLTHLRECLSNQELSAVPISMFTTDGSMLHCLTKSLQIDIFLKKACAVN